MHLIALSEPFYKIFTMLINSLNQITGNANIKCTVSFAGKYINARLLVYKILFDKGLNTRHSGMNARIQCKG